MRFRRIHIYIKTRQMSQCLNFESASRVINSLGFFFFSRASSFFFPLYHSTQEAFSNQNTSRSSHTTNKTFKAKRFSSKVPSLFLNLLKRSKNPTESWVRDTTRDTHPSMNPGDAVVVVNLPAMDPKVVLVFPAGYHGSPPEMSNIDRARQLNDRLEETAGRPHQHIKLA